ncbi:hypothetical protein [Aquisediminimonas profunda]|uniref:hypothetical protein n=1 Tax=Aquisediminimonas profunda TaxID=1550733 RepID=UPI001C629A35|nr:hypothetical protein [Aquisediminimonas profunda]
MNVYPMTNEDYDSSIFEKTISTFGEDAARGWKLAFELVHGKGTFDQWIADFMPDEEIPWVLLRGICRKVLNETERTRKVLPPHLRHPIECATVVLDTYASLSRYSSDWDFNANNRTVAQFLDTELPLICKGDLGNLPCMLWHGLSAALELSDPRASLYRYLAQQDGDLDLDDMSDLCERALASDDHPLEKLPQYTQHALALTYQACQALITLELDPEKWRSFLEASWIGPQSPIKIAALPNFYGPTLR